MLNDLKFVAGAVNTKDIVEALSHFRIKDGVIKGYNGVVGLCTPIDIDLDVTPNAKQLTKAVQACEETIQIHVTAKGKLSIRSGKFKALVDCLDNTQYPEILPSGEYVKSNFKLIPIFKMLKTFVSEDATRNWSRGILLKGRYAYATNNIVLARCDLGVEFPKAVNIPKIAIDQLIRIGEEAEYLQIDDNRVSFLYEENKWLSCQTYSNEWPNLDKFFENFHSNTFNEYDKELLTDIEKITPFVDEMSRIILTEDGNIKTHNDGETGATIANPKIRNASVFNSQMLMDVLRYANKIDFSKYPNACPFYSDENNIQGVLIGIKSA
jgi:DNA polymerase III sliding clamp (beta) subunit (PCNA family)